MIQNNWCPLCKYRAVVVKTLSYCVFSLYQYWLAKRAGYLFVSCYLSSKLIDLDCSRIRLATACLLVASHTRIRVKFMWLDVSLRYIRLKHSSSADAVLSDSTWPSWIALLYMTTIVLPPKVCDSCLHSMLSILFSHKWPLLFLLRSNLSRCPGQMHSFLFNSNNRLTIYMEFA